MFACSHPVMPKESASALATIMLKPIVQKNKIIDFRIKDWNHAFISYFGLDCLYVDMPLGCLGCNGNAELVEMFLSIIDAETSFTSKSLLLKLQKMQYFTTVVRHRETYIFTFYPIWEDILQKTYQDELTGLFNRAYYDKQMERYNREKTWPFSIILLDINGLKPVNDSFGHDAGDQYLQRISAILQSMFTETGFVARIGGDEFAVVLSGIHADELQSLVRQLRIRCREDKLQPFKINIAIGSASRRNEYEDIWAVVAKAENRLNQNKLLGGNNARNNLILSLRQSLEEKTHETQEHSQRLMKLSVRLGSMLGLTDNQIDELKLLAFMHDIGKIGVADSILEKPTKLTPAEWEEMKRHCEIGYRIALASPELASIAESILSHHERWDGSGYPQGLKGEEIPLLARIISVLDAYDTMTHGRVYRGKISQEAAIAEIKGQRGKQFDPKVVDVFLAMMEKEMLLKKLQKEREKLHKLAKGQDFTSQELLNQSRYVDQIINQIYRLNKVQVLV